MLTNNIVFEKYLKKISKYLKVTGLCIDEDDVHSNFKQRLIKRWFLMINFPLFNIVVFFEIVWFINGVLIGRTLSELTYVFPCFTCCLLGNLKMVSFFYYAHHVLDIISTIKRLQTHNQRLYVGNMNGINKRLKLLNLTLDSLGIINLIAPVSFGLCTLLVMTLTYIDTQKIELTLPFDVLYPFNAYDIKIYPIIYLHQVWCGFYAVFGFFGPDSFFYTSATFIHIEMCSLQYDITEIKPNELKDVALWMPKLHGLLERHRQLIRCINMLEVIFSKSTLFNVVTSSFLLCLTGFNIVTGPDAMTIFTFTSFFVMGVVQIFIFCYNGDLLSKSTVECSSAVYNSKWYVAEAGIRKDLLFILARSQKPCKLTASGFMDIDLKAFARIMSASWSYFALLFTMYRDQSK